MACLSELTVSMFTEAASLFRNVSGGVTCDGRNSFPAQLSEEYLPSVVIIAINVKNLISLDTQNTIY